MKPLPDEGGYYIETYRAKENLSSCALPARYAGQRSIATAILYLLTDDKFSRLHRLKTDEIFHFYLGDPVIMLQLYPDGTSKVITLGQNISNNEHLQVTVPQGTWQGCFIAEGTGFALMGTTTAPGFEFDDYETADKRMLLEQYPDQRKLILRLAP